MERALKERGISVYGLKMKVFRCELSVRDR